MPTPKSKLSQEQKLKLLHRSAIQDAAPQDDFDFAAREVLDGLLKLIPAAIGAGGSL